MHALVHGVPRGEHENQRLPARLAQACKHLPSIQPGKHDVKNDQVEIDFQGEVQTLQAICGNIDNVAGFAQVPS